MVFNRNRLIAVTAGTLVVAGAIFLNLQSRLGSIDEFYDDTYGKDGPPTPAESAAAAKAKNARTRINPGPYRLQFVMLEKILYNPDAKYDDGWTLEVRSKSLADSLWARPVDELQNRTAAAVARFSASVGSAMGNAYPRGPKWAEWREQWESLRRAHFESADFFANHDPAGMPLARNAGPVAADDRATVRQLNDFAIELQGVIRRGRDSALAIPEPPNPVVQTTTEGKAQIQRWRDWADRWDREAGALEAPVVTTAADAYIWAAALELREALGDIQMSGVSTEGKPYPAKQTRRQRFESADAHVNRARDRLISIGTKR